LAWVYILRCADGSLYCGWTVDLETRLAVHRAGKGSRYVARRLPAEIAWAQEMEDRSAAMREEARIKKLTRREKLELVAGAN
jgi:putative endonuclease